MSLDAMPAGQPVQLQLARPVELTRFALAVAQVVYVAALFVRGSRLIDPHGQPIATDFVNVWAAGSQVLDGRRRPSTTLSPTRLPKWPRSGTPSTAIVIAALWRSRVSFDLRAAALAIGGSSPHPTSSSTTSSCWRCRWRSSFARTRVTAPVAGEMLGFAAVALLIAIFPLAKAPVGFAAVLVVALLIARRASLAPTAHALPFVRAQAGTPGRNAPLSR